MKHSKEFELVFLSAPQRNTSNSGKGKEGNYKRPYNKTKASEVGNPKEYQLFPCSR